MERISIEHSITKDKIKVESSCTIFINKERKQTIDIIALEKDIKEIKKICKERKIIFSQKNGYYTFFKGNKNHYLFAMQNVNLLFDKLVQGWQQKVKKGIYTGYSDDTELNNLLQLSWQIDALYQKNIISKIHTLYHNVQELKEDLQDSNINFEKIVL